MSDPSASNASAGFSRASRILGFGERPADPFATFQIPEQAIYQVPDVAREDVMPTERVRKLYDEIFKKLGVKDALQKTLVMNALRVYAVLNGTSPKGKYTAQIQIQGSSFSSSVLVEVLGSEIRQFFRPQADQVHQLLLQNDSIAKEAANKWGFDSELGPYAFDFSEYCTSLAGEQRKRVLKAKNFHISSASPAETDFADLVAGPSAKGTSPHRLGHASSGDDY